MSRIVCKATRFGRDALRITVLASACASGPVAAQDARERCLIEALRGAAPTVTVGQLQRACDEVLDGPRAPDPSRGPPAKAPDAPGADAESDAGVPLPPIAPLDLSVDPPPRLGSPVERRIADEAQLWSNPFSLMPHRQNYLLALSYDRDIDRQPAGNEGAEVQNTEVKFQFSLKFPLTRPLLDGRVGLFFAYTGQSWWQAYNGRRSTPFREYNHEPELFASVRTDFHLLGWRNRMSTFGINHQSNGQSGDLSRSWNRLVAEFLFDRGSHWWLSVRPWVRIPERNKTGPDDVKGDDNPYISRYYGNGELRLGYVGQKHNVTLMARHALGTGGRGAMQIDWSAPTGFSTNLRWYAQAFVGYGESLIDYDQLTRRIGVGLMLSDWF